MHPVEANVRAFLDRIAGRAELCAVVKKRNAEEIRLAYAAGVRHFGMNYAQESLRLKEESALPSDARWHFIGHLQSNKVAQILGAADSVQSVDRSSLVEALAKRAALAGRVLPVLIEVNSAREEAKSGCAPEAVGDLARRIAEFPSLRLEGLMTMGPAEGGEAALRPAFRLTKSLFDELKGSHPELHRLSMGMSDSWEWAVEEGATQVRIGTALFGERS